MKSGGDIEKIFTAVLNGSINKALFDLHDYVSYLFFYGTHRKPLTDDRYYAA